MTSESRDVDPLRGIGYGDQVAEMVPSAGVFHSDLAISFEEAAEGLTPGQSLVLKLCSGLPLTDIDTTQMALLGSHRVSGASPTVFCFNMGRRSGKTLIAQRLQMLYPDITSLYSPYRGMGRIWDVRAASQRHGLLIFDEIPAAEISTARFERMILFHTTSVRSLLLPVAPTFQMCLSTFAMRDDVALGVNDPRYVESGDEYNPITFL